MYQCCIGPVSCKFHSQDEYGELRAALAAAQTEAADAAAAAAADAIAAKKKHDARAHVRAAFATQLTRGACRTSVHLQPALLKSRANGMTVT